MSVIRERYEVGESVEINLARGRKPDRWVPAMVIQTDVRLSGIGGVIDSLLGLKRATVQIGDESEIYPGEEALIVNSLDRRDIKPKSSDRET